MDKYDILSNNRRSRLHAVIDYLFFSLPTEFLSQTLPHVDFAFKKISNKQAKRTVHEFVFREKLAYAPFTI